MAIGNFLIYGKKIEAASQFTKTHLQYKTMNTVTAVTFKWNEKEIKKKMRERKHLPDYENAAIRRKSMHRHVDMRRTKLLQIIAKLSSKCYQHFILTIICTKDRK
jgi:hypothetical protein